MAAILVPDSGCVRLDPIGESRLEEQLAKSRHELERAREHYKLTEDDADLNNIETWLQTIDYIATMIMERDL